MARVLCLVQIVEEVLILQKRVVPVASLELGLGAIRHLRVFLLVILVHIAGSRGLVKVRTAVIRA